MLVVKWTLWSCVYEGQNWTVRKISVGSRLWIAIGDNFNVKAGCLGSEKSIFVAYILLHQNTDSGDRLI